MLAFDVSDIKNDSVYSLGVKLKFPPRVRLSEASYSNSASRPKTSAPPAARTDVEVLPNVFTSVVKV